MRIAEASCRKQACGLPLPQPAEGPAAGSVRARGRSGVPLACYLRIGGSSPRLPHGRKELSECRAGLQTLPMSEQCRPLGFQKAVQIAVATPPPLVAMAARIQ